MFGHSRRRLDARRAGGRERPDHHSFRGEGCIVAGELLAQRFDYRSGGWRPPLPTPNASSLGACDHQIVRCSALVATGTIDDTLVSLPGGPHRPSLRPAPARRKTSYSAARCRSNASNPGRALATGPSCLQAGDDQLSARTCTDPAPQKLRSDQPSNLHGTLLESSTRTHTGPGETAPAQAQAVSTLGSRYHERRPYSVYGLQRGGVAPCN